MTAFLADVLEPVLNAFAPPRARLMKRLRNAGGLAALCTLLLPRYGPLGTATTASLTLLVLAYAACGVLAIALRDREGGPPAVAGAFVAAGALVAWAGGGATWGLVLGAITVGAVVLTEVRLRAPALPRPPPEYDPMPAAVKGFPVFLGGLAHTFAVVFVTYHFVAEPTHIPTGSMQPTLMGDRQHAGGDYVLADRAAWAWREPRRWEIAVFRYPLRRDILFVKRIVGLPGEHVEIRDGDIWIDGMIARKPGAVQETLWREVFPRSNPLAKPKPVAGNWKVSEDQGFRRAGDHGLRFAPRGERAGMARFGRSLGVPDVRLTLRVSDVAGPGRVVAQLDGRGASVRMDLPAGGHGEPGSLVLDGEAPVPLEGRVGKTALVQFESVDGVARVLVDGVEAGRLEIPLDGRGRALVEFGGSGAEMVFRDIRLEEDVEYRHASPGPSVFDTPDDGYVVLGDNTRNSMDSRAWYAVAIHVKGRAEPLWAEPTSPGMDGSRAANIQRKDGFVTFVDVDGVTRRIAREDVEREDPPASVPFVRRADMLGRGALVYWPWVPSEAGFRPRLVP